MRLVFLIIVCFISKAFGQTEIKTQIQDIDYGNGKEEPLIFLTSGQVVTFALSNRRLLEELKKGLANRNWFVFKINTNRELTAIREVSAPVAPAIDFQKSFQTDAPYVPSVLENTEQAMAIFQEARTDHKSFSQCYNRAHIWTYEWRTKRNLYSSKAWLFFTRKFIRKYKFDWWFHVAPMFHVTEDGKVKQRMMDKKYSKAPLTIKQWTDIFVRDNADCPVVEKYSDHADYPESGSCFLMKSSMYYYQPVDLEEQEFSGLLKQRWVETEVRHAYEEAFGIKLGEKQ